MSSKRGTATLLREPAKRNRQAHLPIAVVQKAYAQGLEAQHPSREQLLWRLSRFARGLELVSEIETIRGGLENARIADLGAAHGGDCCAFLTAGAQPVAVDFRNHGYTALNDSLRAIGTKLDVILANVTDTLPFGDSSVDVVVAINLLEHVPDTTKFLLDLWRVLKPGGVVLLTTPVAWRHVWSDPFYRSPFTALLPMPLRRAVAVRLFGRTYPFPLSGKTCYSSRSITAPAARVGFAANACKYKDSPVARRVGRWPLRRLWLSLIRRYAFDFVVLQKSGAGTSASTVVSRSSL